jgi:hypothetical protein
MTRTLVLTFFLTFATAAQATLTPPTTLIPGTVISSVATPKNGYFCEVSPGPGSFERPAATSDQPNPPVMISTPQIRVLNQSVVLYDIYGIGVLRFNSPTTGTINFDYDSLNSSVPSYETAAFDSYSSAWTPSASTLQVTFNIKFRGCTVPYQAFFRAIP